MARACWRDIKFDKNLSACSIQRNDLNKLINHQAPVIRRVDNANHEINCYSISG